MPAVILSDVLTEPYGFVDTITFPGMTSVRCFSCSSDVKQFWEAWSVHARVRPTGARKLSFQLVLPGRLGWRTPDGIKFKEKLRVLIDTGCSVPIISYRVVSGGESLCCTIPS